MRRHVDSEVIAGLVDPDRIHRDVYVNELVFERELEWLFPNVWMFVGHDSQTPNHGDYFTTQIADQSVIQIRGSEGAMHVLHNRCPHKGTKLVIDREGNTGGFFRCPYHAWTFKTDGCLLATPLGKGYAGLDHDSWREMNRVRSVGAVRNYGGFIFARLASDGISFEEFFGDSLSTIDNLLARSPVGRVEVAGPPLRYMHHCNWKMLVENQTDTCHPMVAHESSAGAAVLLWESLAPNDGGPIPPAMEIIAPFMSSYSFFEEMGIRTWPHGHGHTGVHHSIHSNYSQVPEYLECLEDAYGVERTKAILGENRHNTIYFPNVMVKASVQQLRNFIPVAVDRTLVESYVYRLIGAPDDLVRRSSIYNRMINAPTSVVGHDDLEMYERAHEGLKSNGNEWVNMQRLFVEGEDFGTTEVVNGTSERQMRNQMQAWRTFMLRGASA